MTKQNFGFIRTWDWADQTPLSEYSDAKLQSNVSLLWKYYEAATGQKLAPRDQFSTSSCVGQATATAIDVLMGVQIAGLGRPDALNARVDATSLYAGSRYEIAYEKMGRRMRGKGSHVPYAAEYVNQYGVLFMGPYPEVDLTKFDADICRDWERNGVPDHLEPIARMHPVQDWIAVKNVDEALVALSNGWPVVIGSSYGFRSQPSRDDDGFLRPKGTWNHAMVYIGADTEFSRPGVACMNSWGTRWLSSENARRDIPDGSFWIELDTVDDMIRSGEAVALSNVLGLEPQTITYKLL